MTFSDYMRLIVPVYIPPALMAILIGYFVTMNTPNILPKLIFALISALLITSGYNAFNAIYDKEIDKINKPYRPVANERLNQKHVMHISIGLFIIALIFSYLINIEFFVIMLIAIIFAIAYSYPPLYLKKHFIIGTATGNSIYSILFPLAGSAINSNLHIPLGIIAFLFFFGFGTGVLKDFEDLKGDKKHDVKTIPHVLGRKRAVLFSLSAFLISLVILIALVAVHIFTMSYLIIILFVLFALLNVGIILNNYSRKVFKRVFLTGMLILTITEIVIIAVILL